MEIVVISFCLLSFLAVILRCLSTGEMQKEAIANNDFSRLVCCILNLKKFIRHHF